MDIDIYREFIVLTTHKSFVAAANELNMSQPSLSRHMSSLQNELGCKLFYDTRPLSLTAAGEVVLKYAGKIVGDQANMMNDLQELSASDSSRIIITDMLHTNNLYYGINEAIAQAKSKFGGLRVDYIDMNSSGMNPFQMVEKGKVDISFETTITMDTAPELEVPDGLRSVLIPEFHGELVIGVDKTSPLSGRQDLCLTDLKRARFVMQANRYNERFREDFIELCRLEGFYPNITLVPADNPLSFYASSVGDGIHLLTRVSMKQYKPFMADLIKQMLNIVPFADKKRYVNAYAVMQDDISRPEMEFVAACLEEHAAARIAEL